MDQNPPTRLASHSTGDGETPTQRSSQFPPVPDNSRRCRFCAGLTIKGLVNLREKHDSQRIFWGSAPYEHHASIGDLERSADLGCDFCQFIIDCSKRARLSETESWQREVFVGENLESDEDSERAGQSLYAIAKEMDEPSQVWLAITGQMRLNLPSGEAFSGGYFIYDSLRVKVGNLPSMLLNLIVSRDEPICFQGDRIAELPANFRDAIHVTRQLGLRYLWIDVLCILQDSNEDWAIESEKMGSIYQDSTLAIFASTSQGSTDGFLKVANQSQPKYMTLKVFPTTDSQRSVSVTVREVEEERFTTVRWSSALSKRGWAYQESILSCRSLYFGARQFYWMCPQKFDSLGGLHPFTASHPDMEVILPDVHGQLGKGDVNAMQSYFYKAVLEYTIRDLTHSSDKLPAFSGLAQRFHPVFGGTYLAGLWSTDFRHGLLWSRWPSARSSSYSAVRPYRAPSWSWASMNGWIRWDCRQNLPFLQLHSWDIWPRSEHNPYGEVLPPSGPNIPFVIVSGPTMQLVRGNEISGPDDQRLHMIGGEVTFDVLEELEQLVVSEDDTLPLTIVDNAHLLSLICDETEMEQCVADRVLRPPCKYLALIVSGRSRSGLADVTDVAVVSGLVLRESSDAFERVGIWDMRLDNANWSWKGWENKTLKLI